MRKVIIPVQFERELKKFLKKRPEFSPKIKMVINTLAQDPFSKKVQAHKLKGYLKNKWAASIFWNYRVIYSFSEDDISFLDIGSHDDVY